MNVNSISYAAVASKVWSSVSRKLTGFGSLITGPVASANNTLAASSNVDMRGVNAANFREGNLSVLSTSTVNVDQFDGTNNYVALAVSNGSGSVYVGPWSTTVGPVIRNTSGATAATYATVYNEWVF